MSVLLESRLLVCWETNQACAKLLPTSLVGQGRCCRRCGVKLLAVPGVTLVTSSNATGRVAELWPVQWPDRGVAGGTIRQAPSLARDKSDAVEAYLPSEPGSVIGAPDPEFLHTAKLVVLVQGLSRSLRCCQAASQPNRVACQKSGSPSAHLVARRPLSLFPRFAIVHF